MPTSSPRRLTYANVVSTLALVIAVGGGGAAVAAGLAKNSVGSPQIRDGAVKRADLGRGSVVSAKVKDGSVTGADVKEASLGRVPSAKRADAAAVADNVLGAVVNANGTLVKAQSTHASTAGPLFPGSYEVVFDRDVTGCAYSVSVGESGTGDGVVGFGAVTGRDGNPSAVFVSTFDKNGDIANRPFMVLVVC
ncbi:hypothetical protein [Nocardioides lijunqiniae]|uniref:hypothetical protein n=1 Tax=Nocardioides lijunqiniae TaxID=2760832 RepID=UPI00187875A1|nr:hypothetical protein [Nocardioides lijunqiniae]